MSTGVESKATRSAGAEPKKTGLFADIKNDVIAAVGTFARQLYNAHADRTGEFIATVRMVHSPRRTS